MSIDNLRTEVRELCEVVVNYVSQVEAHEYQLSEDSPANVINDNEIFILDSLSEEKKIQAEAHELGHIFVKEKGLTRIIPNGCGYFNFLILELNNALSHRFVLNTLSQMFGISNELHINLRSKSIESIEQDIEEFKEQTDVLHAFGLRLYDIYKTIPDLRNEVERLIGLNGEVKTAFQAANTYFDAIKPETPKEEQESTINSFLTQLGYEDHKVF